MPDTDRVSSRSDGKALAGATVHRVGHALHMALRGLRNRLTTRLRVTGKGNEIVSTGAVLRRVVIRISGNDNRIEIRPNARLQHLEISMEGSGHRLVVESHTAIKSGCLRFFDDGSTIHVGERTTIYEASFGVIEGGTITIGRDCLFSTGIDVRNGDSHSVIDLSTGRRVNPASDVSVGDHVWIGVRAMLLKGAQIGSGSVVGAGAIVCGPLPGNSVAVGVPARPIRAGVSWSRERS